MHCELDAGSCLELCARAIGAHDRGGFVYTPFQASGFEPPSSSVIPTSAGALRRPWPPFGPLVEPARFAPTGIEGIQGLALRRAATRCTASWPLPTGK
jgi:hypothetical protein